MSLVGEVDEVLFAEELFSEGVSDESEGVGSDIGEDLVGEISVSDEHDEFPEDVVGADSVWG